MINLVIVGAGGLGLEVAAYAEDIARAGLMPINVRGFLDDTKKPGTAHGEYIVLGTTNSPIDSTTHYIIAVGAPVGRKQLAENLMARDAKFVSIIHPSAYVAQSAQIGQGSILAPFVFAGPEAVIGAHCLLNIYASVGHEAQLGAYSSLSPYAGLHGQAKTEEAVFLGAQANLTAEKKMGSGSKLAAGAVAYNDIPPNVTALGNPARFRAE